MEIDADTFRMPYGKFKGQPLCDIPSSYLLWMAENWKEDTEENKVICKAADREWNLRERYNAHI